MKKRIRSISIVLLVALFVPLLAFQINASAKENSSTKKDITTHDIAIVFDNSGSMYDNESWSQALYAVEVFATMVDYDHDKLGIYPMGPISIGKGGTESGDRLDISSKDDVKDIERIYCEHTSETILAPAYKAYDYLMDSSADEVWMIVLTDGAFYYDKDVDTEEADAKKAGRKIEEKTAEWLNKKLNGFAADSGGKIKVQYLGFAEASALTGNPDNNFYVSRANSETDLTKELVNICNQIFQRDRLPDISSDGHFSIDVSMKNMFAFVQGKGANIKTLSSEDGNVIKAVNSTILEASKEGGTNHNRHPSPVANVSGQMVEYGECDAGSYQLDYSGSDVQIFYEPDVIIKSTLTDKDGKEITDFTEDVLPGEYTLSYDLVDRSGKSVSSSSLLGNVVIDDAVVTNNGNSTKVPSGGTIKLDSDSKTSIEIEASYLNNYHITNEDDKGIREINVTPPELDDIKIKTKVEQSEKWYNTGDHDNWKPITVEVEYAGEPLSDKQMAALKPDFSFSPELDYTVEIVPGESKYEVYIGKDKNGEYSEPTCGVYKFDAKVILKDEYGQEAISNTESQKFEVQNYPKFWKWLLRLIIIAAILLLLWFILTRKAWPHKMTFIVKKEGGSTSKKPISPGESMVLVPVFSALTVKAKKNTTLMKKFGKKANIYVTSVKAKTNVDAFYINFIPYESGSGFKDSMGNPFSGVIGNNTQIKIVYNDGKEDLDGEIKINK